MNEYKLAKLNIEVSDKCTFLSYLATRYQGASTPKERIAMAIQMENAATMLRIATERLATETCQTYRKVADHHEH